MRCRAAGRRRCACLRSTRGRDLFGVGVRADTTAAVAADRPPEDAAYESSPEYSAANGEPDGAAATTQEALDRSPDRHRRAPWQRRAAGDEVAEAGPPAPLLEFVALIVTSSVESMSSHVGVYASLVAPVIGEPVPPPAGHRDHW
jgi:hypothetical protein